MPDEESEVTWWKTLLWGLLCLVLAAVLFWYFSNLEESGGTRRINWIVAIIYKIGGKWTVSAIFGLASLMFFYLPFKQLRGHADE